MEEAAKILRQIDRARNIVLIGHKNIDGDCLGSLLAFRQFLIKRDNKPILISVDEPSQNLAFLPHLDQIQSNLPPNFDLLIALDCASLSQTGFEEKLKTKKIINIDHHATNDSFGFLNLIDSKAAATCQIIYWLLREWGIKIDRKIAIYLLVGIMTDTGGFQYSNTTKDVLEVASDLLKYGVNIEKINRHLFGTKSLPALKIWGIVLERIIKNKKYNIAASYVTEDDLKKLGATEEDLEGIANFMSEIPNVSAIMFISERQGMIKGSLRSTKDDIDVSVLAQMLGGGGHQKAAGFSVPGKLRIKNGKIKMII